MTYRQSLCVFVVSACAASAAVAQSTASVATSSETGPAGLEEIVVTAQRRAQNLQDVPIAISAVTANELASAGITDMQSLGTVSPSFQSSEADNWFTPRIRGVGTTAYGAGLENPIAVYVDGVYIAAAPADLFSFNNIERIEIVKGPQGTLFGRNATGGLIQVITKDPSSQPGGSVELGYGDYQTITGAAYVTGGIAPGVAADLAVEGTRQGQGYGRNYATGTEANQIIHDVSARSKLLIEPTDTTAIRISADYSDFEGNTSPRSAPGYPPVFGPQTYGSPWDVDNNTPTLNRIKQGGASINVQQDFAVVKLLSISAYRASVYDTTLDYDLTSTPAFYLHIIQRDRQLSQELQLQSETSSPIAWVVGGYFFLASGENDPSNAYFEGPLVPTSTSATLASIQADQRTRSFAGFAQATAPIGFDTNLTLGIRYTSENRSIDGQNTITLANGASFGVFPGGYEASKTFTKPTWRASLDHKFGETLAYVSYNRGFKSGGFNPQLSGSSFEPEVLDAYEIGTKSTLFNNRLRVNPSFYYYNYTNLQSPFYTTTGQIAIENGAKAKIYGLDLDLEFAVTPDFHLLGGASWIHDRYTDYKNAVFNIPEEPGTLQTFGDATGNRLPFTADWATSLSANYTVHFGGTPVDFNLTHNHSNGFYSEPDNLRKQSPYDVVNASIAVTPSAGRLTVRAWVKNAANEAIVNTLAGIPFGTGVQYQPPRTFGVSAVQKF